MCEYSFVLLGVWLLLNVYLYNIVVIMNVWELKHCCRIEILDCYTDPLGWKDALLASENGGSLSNEASTGASLCRNVKDMDKLYSSIIELGKGIGRMHISFHCFVVEL